jgi:hypothetical protein
MENDFYAGEIDEEEYDSSIWTKEELQPQVHGRVFTPKMTGTGYTRH